MDLSDEDPFAVSDDETAQTACKRSPVEEHLLKQRHDILKKVEEAKSSVEETRKLSDNIMKKLHAKALCGESSSSDSESDLYQATGEPVIKKMRLRSPMGTQLLNVVDVWQKVIDEKWIVGVVLENASSRTLENPCLYVCVKNEREIRGIASFWYVVDDSLWTRTEKLDPDSEKLVATVVLELPSFENHDFYEAFGTIAYVLDGKQLQSPVPNFRLGATEAIDRSRAPRFTADAENSVLAIKAVSVERTLSISLEGDAGRGLRLLEFLENRGFKELEKVSDVYLSKNQESFKYCIFEILPSTESQATVRISARSSSQLNIILHMLREQFPDVYGPDSNDRLMEAALALQNELELELRGADVGALHMARIRTDLLIP